MVFMYNEISFSPKNEENPVTLCNIGEREDIVLSKIHQSQKTNTVWLYLYGKHLEICFTTM